ncbi:hypothetical protein K227x_59320 [Rubripirellula lacrimiformis]|uniref:Uncharacterized protein n=2 Tax=Rubripirellula lacrimiformis TaxID=1930273 RepID=A0A517NK39_9BACT|nr:hypothetical protein K227x_59320 [Rubripirellula lacrimiformis]
MGRSDEIHREFQEILENSTPDRLSAASSITANRCNVPRFIPEGEVKTTESTTEDELEEAFLAEPRFGLDLLHTDFEDRIARFIKSRLYGIAEKNQSEAIRDIYCNTMVSLAELAKKPDFDWRDPMRIVIDIARKRVADHFRVRKRSHKQDIDGALDAIAAALSGTQVEAAWQITSEDDRARFRRVLSTAIETKLTPKEVDVASCYVDHFEEFTPNNIYGPLAARVSERTGKIETAMTVKKQWKQARAKLMRELAKNGFTFPDIEE